MKMLLSSRGLFILGFIILLATNIVVLSGVAYNRSDNPVNLISLTERELQLPYKVQEENSGLSLRLSWRVLGEGAYYNQQNWESPVWLNKEKLGELGFNVIDQISLNKIYNKRPLPKEVLIVLEYEGEPYKEAKKRAEIAVEKAANLLKLEPEDKGLRNNFEYAEKRLKSELNNFTRLFAIDAGLSLKSLRKRYSDLSSYIITKGLVRVTYNKKTNKIFGHITGLSIASIHVPLEHRKIFDGILANGKAINTDYGTPPRYKVELAYGSRVEPWILSVKNINDKVQ